MTTATEDIEAARSVVVEVRRPDGRVERRDLGADGGLILGSAASCGLPIDEPDIAAFHCWIRVTRGEVHVQDWNSDGGTFVDGQRIGEDPVALGPGQVLQVGETTIVRVDDGNAPQTASKASAAPEEADQATGAAEPDGSAADDSDDSEAAVAESTPDGPELATAGSGPLEDVDEDALVGSDFDWDAWSQSLPSTADGGHSGPSLPGADPFDAEFVELLQAEVEQLRSELAERDARLAELEQGDELSDPEEEGVEEDAVRILDRLEELLGELQESDRRAKTLEELLLSADEAVEAEREERHQIEAWIGELEARIREREDERQAEFDELRHRLQEAEQQRDRAEEVFRDGQKAGQMVQAQQKLVAELRAKLEETTRRLTESETSRKELERRLESANVDDFEKHCAERVEELLREERLQLAEERTELARQRAEAARATAVEREASDTAPQQPPDEMTVRLTALRQHLREIHEQEQQQERTDRRLSTRISRLWKRLDK